MGFRHWVGALELIGLFLFVVAVPCYFTGLWGTRMINEMGNHPTRSALIQAAAAGKIIAVQAVSLILFIALFAFLYNIQNS